MLLNEFINDYKKAGISIISFCHIVMKYSKTLVLKNKMKKKKRLD